MFSLTPKFTYRSHSFQTHVTCASDNVKPEISANFPAQLASSIRAEKSLSVKNLRSQVYKIDFLRFCSPSTTFINYFYRDSSFFYKYLFFRIGYIPLQLGLVMIFMYMYNPGRHYPFALEMSSKLSMVSGFQFILKLGWNFRSRHCSDGRRSGILPPSFTHTSSSWPHDTSDC